MGGGGGSYLGFSDQGLPVFVAHVLGALQPETGHGVKLLVHWEEAGSRECFYPESELLPPAAC